jgi:deoxyribose-phosphate aldolase
MEPRPPLATAEDFAKLIDFALLAPSLDEARIHQGCELARRHGLASVTVRPADVQLVSRWMPSSSVRVGTVASYPHGDATTAVKIYEVRDLVQRGARHIETVLNIGKMLSRQFQYVEMELTQMVTECHNAGAILILDLELGWLAQDQRVIACKIAKRSGVDVVRAGSLYGPGGYTTEDLQFLIGRFQDHVRVDAGPSIGGLEEALAAYETGCNGFQTTDPAPLIAAWEQELARWTAAAAEAAAAEPAGHDLRSQM